MFGDENDEDVGMLGYNHASNYLAFTVNAAERVRITSGGEVGINTTVVPYGNFSVDHGQYGLTRISGYSHILVQNKNASTTEFWNFAPRDDGSVSIGRGVPGDTGIITDRKLIITSDGSLQVKGDANPNAVFDRGSANTTNVNINYNGTTTGQLGGANQEFQLSAVGASTPMTFYANGSEKMRIDSNGLVVGSISFDSNNSIGVRLFAHGTVHSTRDSEYAYVGRRSNSNGGMFLFRRDSTDVGNISVTTSATSYNSGSDYRLKQDDTPLIDGLTRLKQLKPIKFKWKNDTSQFVDGFFAHEVSSIVPNAITGEKDAVYEKDDELGHKKGDPIYQQIDHGKLVPLLVAALQEEIVKREELEARVAALEAA
jgi:hypothetical protein